MGKYSTFMREYLQILRPMTRLSLSLWTHYAAIGSVSCAAQRT